MNLVAQKKAKKTPALKAMVQEAIRALKEPRGSSLHAINKYVAANYTVDSDNLSSAINKYLKTAVASGEVVQTKGKGASCFFRLAADPARSRRALSIGQREQKTRAAKTKAKLAIKAAASTGQRRQINLAAKTKAKLAFMAALQLTPKSKGGHTQPSHRIVRLRRRSYQINKG